MLRAGGAERLRSDVRPSLRRPKIWEPRERLPLLGTSWAKRAQFVPVEVHGPGAFRSSPITKEPWIRMSPAALRSSFHPRNQARPWVVSRSDDDDVERIHIRLISGRSPNQST